jgi:hypothetical protein
LIEQRSCGWHERLQPLGPVDNHVEPFSGPFLNLDDPDRRPAVGWIPNLGHERVVADGLLLTEVVVAPGGGLVGAIESSGGEVAWSRFRQSFAKTPRLELLVAEGDAGGTLSGLSHHGA